MKSFYQFLGAEIILLLLIFVLNTHSLAQWRAHLLVVLVVLSILAESFIHSLATRFCTMAVTGAFMCSVIYEMFGRGGWSGAMSSPIPAVLSITALLVGIGETKNGFLVCLPIAGGAIPVLISPVSDTGEFRVMPVLIFLALNVLCFVPGRIVRWERRRSALNGIAVLVTVVAGVWALSVPRLRSMQLAMPWLLDHIVPNIIAPCAGAYVILLLRDVILSRTEREIAAES
jgi:hypothetical protein